MSILFSDRMKPRWLPNLLAVGVLAGLVGSLLADPLPRDPVAQFRDALRLESKARSSGDIQEKNLIIRFREENLRKAAARLKGLSDIGRALQLIDWPAPDPVRRIEKNLIEEELRRIEETIRSELLERFLKELRQLVDSGTPGQQLAAANIVNEFLRRESEEQSIGFAENLLSRKLPVLIREMIRLARKSQGAVQEAAVLALGRFYIKSEVFLGKQAFADATAALHESVVLLRELLDQRQPESLRIAVANSLVNLTLLIMVQQPGRASQPGISATSKTTPTTIPPLETTVEIVKEVSPVAGLGLSDPSLAVRRPCATALRQAASALSYQSKYSFQNRLQTYPNREYPPPRQRDWSPKEQEEVQQDREAIESYLQEMILAIEALARVGPSIRAGTRDSDAQVRRDLWIAIDDLARIRDFIQKARDKYRPQPLKKPAGKPREDATLRQRPDLMAVSALQNQKPDAPANPKDDNKEAINRKVLTQYDQMLDELVQALPNGLCDPDVRVRRNTAEATRFLGRRVVSQTAALVAALKDDDLFVRWIVARTLGLLAPEEDTPATPEEVRVARLAVPGLIYLLDDPDLSPRIEAIQSLSRFGPLAAAAVESIAQRLGKGDAEVRIELLKALGEIGTAAAPALPQVAAGLESLDPRIRLESARLLGRFGGLARGQVDALFRHRDDIDPEVRQAVNAALLQILQP